MLPFRHPALAAAAFAFCATFVAVDPAPDGARAEEARSQPTQIAQVRLNIRPSGNLTLEHEGVTRTYSVHVPSNLDRRQAAPLVLVFHGGYGSGRMIERHTGMDETADANGFIVAYPDGLDGHWNDGRETTADGADDVGFVKALIAELKQRFRIDPDRIYATGASNGGYFVENLACTVSDQIAAVAAVMASLPVELKDRCEPVRPISVMIIAGKDDPLVPWNGGDLSRGRELGGRGGTVTSVPDAAAFWASQAGCDPTPQSEMLPDKDRSDGTRVEQTVYTQCRQSAEVILLGVEGGGHTWPGTTERAKLTRIVGKTSQDIVANDEIAQFFARHRLQGPTTAGAR